MTISAENAAILASKVVDALERFIDNRIDGEIARHEEARHNDSSPGYKSINVLTRKSRAALEEALAEALMAP